MRFVLCSRHVFLALVTASCFLSTQAATAQLNREQDEPSGDLLKIKRDAIHLIPPEQFRVPISLEPTRKLDIRTLVNGIIRNVRVESGARVSAQEEVVQIESARAAKQLERAKTNLKAATLKRDLVQREVNEGDQPQVALDLANTELELAKADLDLAQLNFDNTSVRAPFAGEIVAVQTVQGAYVNKGDLLMTLRDPSELQARIPVDRTEVKSGDTLEVTLDTGKETGTVRTILPLTEKWQPLRQIVDTAAIAVVVFDNQSGNLQDGQTAYSDIVPRQPVIEVANTTLRNSETGARIIQVIRDSLVRDIEVKLLSPIGESRSWVSGPLQSDDEIVVESSEALEDGMIVLPANPAAPEPEQQPGNSPRNQNNTGQPGI